MTYLSILPKIRRYLGLDASGRRLPLASSFTAFLRWVRRVLDLEPSRRPSPPPRTFRPCLECLEGRVLPNAGPLTVTKTADDGTAGTFRWAIGQANANPGSTISFDIPTQGTPQTITLNAALGALPAITAAVTIDGYTQGSPEGFGLPAIEIDGGNLAADGLTINAGSVTLEGLAVDNFNGNGIVLNNPLGTSDTVTGCYAGVALNGTTQAANSGDGLLIKGADNTIGSTAMGGNLCIFSGNGGNGIHLTGSGALRNTIDDAYLGVDSTGKTALVNGNSGILLEQGAGNNTIGGQVENVISGNAVGGIYVYGSNSNQIAGNLIGLGVDGSTVVGNGQDGITLLNGSSNNIIGAQLWPQGAANVISGNGREGILLSGPGITGNQIMNNFVGTDATGTIAKGNQQDGVNINATNSNTIGGSTPMSGNLISGNLGNGIYLNAANNILVAGGNRIGTNAGGTAELGNKKDGILITGNNNTIGVAVTGTSANASNVISGNSYWGVEISGGNLNSLVNNFIGTDISGGTKLGPDGKPIAIPNAEGGVEIDYNTNTSLASTNNTIGAPVVDGTQTANIISGNGTSGAGNQDMGISISGTGTTGNVVQGNDIGVAWDGLTALGNGNDGVYIAVGANGNTIGGTTGATRNIISANGTEKKSDPNIDGYGVDVRSNNNLIEYDIIGLNINKADPNGDMGNAGGWQNDQGTGNVWLNDSHQ